MHIIIYNNIFINYNLKLICVFYFNNHEINKEWSDVCICVNN